ncbi:MAG TPA: hypothetical protein VN708_27050 [Terriglobales bacterium]|jgi:hypothetical protein|nr:hypothetical protein [Terriglobales bacterium]
MNVTIVRLLLALLLTVASCLAKDKPLLSEGFQKAGLRALIVVMNEDDPDSDRVKNAMDDAEAQQNNSSDELMFSHLLIFEGMRRLQRPAALRECKNDIESALRLRKAIDLPKSCHY